MSVASTSSAFRKRKHWVYAIGRDIKGKAEGMINLMRIQGKDYEFIRPGDVKKIQAGDVLYIHCHGFPGSEETNNEQRMWIDKDYSGVKTEKANAKEFAVWLENKGLLGQNVHSLKLAACHSDEFSKGLYLCLKDKYPNLTVYGYKGELVVCQGDNFGKLAGLEPPLIDITSRGHPIVQKEIDKPGIKEQYRAKAQRVSSGPKVQATHSNISSSKNEDDKKVREESSASTITAPSHTAMGTGHASTLYSNSDFGLSNSTTTPPRSSDPNNRIGSSIKLSLAEKIKAWANKILRRVRTPTLPKISSDSKTSISSTHSSPESPSHNTANADLIKRLNQTRAQHDYYQPALHNSSENNLTPTFDLQRINSQQLNSQVTPSDNDSQLKKEAKTDETKARPSNSSNNQSKIPPPKPSSPHR